MDDERFAGPEPVNQVVVPERALCHSYYNVLMVRVIVNNTDSIIYIPRKSIAMDGI